MTQRQIIIDLVEGDDAPPLALRFSGAVLSDYSSIALKVELENTKKRFSRTVTPDGEDDELGTVTWQPGDLVRGRHKAEVEFIQTDTKRFTLPSRYPMILAVRGDLG